MAYGGVEQRCTIGNTNSNKPWRRKRRSGYSKYLKVAKHRSERLKAKREPECVVSYNRYFGYEF